VATLAAMSNRLRSEIGDIGKPFLQTFAGNGTTTRFQLDYKPIQGATLVVKVGVTDVSATTSVDEANGYVILAAAPANLAVVTISGTYFRYFTDAEIQGYITSAFGLHANFSTDTVGRMVTLSTLPTIEEYPVLILASTQALYTLATDAAFDIDIFSPDGVTIPRSERFRQLNELIQTRHAQYQELCERLGIGMYKIEVFNLRRISRITNRYIPIYRPLEVGDFSLPERVYFPVPTYGGAIAPSATGTYDISLVQGDSYLATIDFPFDITGYTMKAQIRPAKNHPVLMAEFTITNIDLVAGTASISLTASQTSGFPLRSYWDLQLTSVSDPNYRRTFVSGFVFCDREVTQGG
jgi:hypothetical protein